MKHFLAAIFILSLSGCASIKFAAEPVPLYQEKYIVIELKDSNTVSVGSRTMSIEQFKDNVAAICKASGSINILLGLKTEFTVGDVLNLVPAFQSFGGQAYFLDSKNEIKAIDFQ